MGQESASAMSSTQSQKAVENEFYVVAHVATTCDEHGVYVTKDSAEVIELGWLLLDIKSLEEVCPFLKPDPVPIVLAIDTVNSYIGKAFW